LRRFKKKARELRSYLRYETSTYDLLWSKRRRKTQMGGKKGEKQPRLFLLPRFEGKRKKEAT